MGELKATLDSVVDKTYDWLIDHPKIAAAASGTGALLAFELSYAALGVDKPDLILQTIELLVSGLVAHNQFESMKKNHVLKELDLDFREISASQKERFYEPSEDRSLRQRVRDSLYEHYNVTAGFLASAVLGSAVSVANSVGDLLVYTGLSAATFLFARSFAKLEGMIHHSSRASINKAQKDYFFLERKARNSRNLDELREFVAKTPFAFVKNAYATLCFDMDLKSEGFEALKEAYGDAVDVESYTESGSVASNIRGNFVRAREKIKENPLSFPSYIQMALNLLRIGKKEEAVEKIASFVNTKTGNTELDVNARFSQALFLRNIGERDSYVEAVTSILSDHYGSLTRIPGSSVYTFQDTEFSGHALVVRPASEQELVNERKYNTGVQRSLNAVNDRRDFVIIDSPEITCLNDEFFGFSVHESAPNLHELYGPPHDHESLSALLDIATFMGRIHRSQPPASPMSEEAYLVQLQIKMGGVEDSKAQAYANKVLDNIPLLMFGFGEIHRVLDIDGHPGNWLKGRHYIKIDNQARAPTLPFYELSKLLEHGRVLPDVAESIGWRDRVIFAYHDELSRGGSVFGSSEDFRILKLRADPIKAFSLYLESLQKDIKPVFVHQYLCNALASLATLGDTYYESKHDLACVKRIKQGMTSLAKLAA